MNEKWERLNRSENISNWEHLSSEDLVEDRTRLLITDRMAVPGGWLCRCIVWDKASANITSVAITFVPAIVVRQAF